MTARAMTEAAPVTVHGSKDIIGVQVAGAIANVASIAAGMAEALEISRERPAAYCSRTDWSTPNASAPISAPKNEPSSGSPEWVS